MSQRTVIIFKGGRDGALLSSPDGVRPIPAFPAAIRGNLVAAASMVRAATAVREEEIAKKLAAQATKLSNLAVEQVEQVVGPLARDRALIYQDDDGGFTCGSTGKPPIPIPWPPLARPSVAALVRSGAIGKDLVELIRTARTEDFSLGRIFEDPAGAAQELGVSLSEQSVRDLQMLSPSNLDNISDEVDQEIAKYFHKVIEDGRFLETWHTRPYEVSRELEVTMSEAALERLISGGASPAFQHLGGAGPYASIGAGVIIAGIAITVGIVGEVAAFELEDVQSMVRDRSGVTKY